MGTRNLTAVVKDGDFKIAQYGQWDGYPSGQGATILRFLREQESLEPFRKAVDRCFFYTRARLDQLNDRYQCEIAAVDEAFSGYTEADRKGKDDARYAEGCLLHLSRDVGGKILDIVLKRPDVELGLKDTRSFAGDSLFCEWAYVIDLDTEVLEVYRGFNKTPTPADSRFPSGAEWLEKSDGYEPVRLIASYPLAELPTEEEFVEALEEL